MDMICAPVKLISNQVSVSCSFFFFVTDAAANGKEATLNRVLDGSTYPS
jgi:hypothetical protein